MITITKSWRDLPAAHRQPKHDGHCRLVHGHNWGFDVTITCERLDENGFVVDVGKLKKVKEWLESVFDHTLLINEDDPLVTEFREFHKRGLVNLVIVPNCGMEGLAKLVAGGIQLVLTNDFGSERGLLVTSVTCFEDSKNSATYLK